MRDVNPIRLLGLTMREAERRASEGMTKWVMGVHSPLEVEPGTVVCHWCRKHPAWPCKEYAEAADRLAALRDRGRST